MRVQKSANFETFDEAAATYKMLLVKQGVFTLTLTCSKLDDGKEFYSLSWSTEEQL